MTPERWQQITSIFESALRRDAAERAVFVAQACKGDDSLQREVEEMLDSHEQVSHFIEEPAMNLAAKLARADEGASLVGQRILPYQVLSLLGAEAIEQARKTVELDPDWPRAHVLLANCYMQKGMYDEALRELQKISLPARGALSARLYVLMGRRDEALKLLAEMKERSKQTGNVPSVALASGYAVLGDKDQAFEYLEKAFVERNPGSRNIKTSPVYAYLRSDPRFADLLKRMRLPP